MFKIPSLLAAAQDSYHTKQIKAFFDWLQADPSDKHGSVYVFLPSLEYHVDQNQRLLEDMSAVGFMICQPKHRSQAFAAATIADQSSWQTIFSSPHLEIWEDRTAHTPESLPLRFGLNESEQAYLTTIIRDYLDHLIGGKPVPEKPLNPLPTRLLYRYDCDVSLWIDGTLRGCIIVTDTPLITALKQAAVLAAHDQRFKPITAAELPQISLEISLISPLRIPLARAEYTQNEIYTNKTYRTEVNGRSGWYVPTAFNTRSYQDLQDLHRSLVVEKVGLPQLAQLPPLTISETRSFITLAEQPTRPRNLIGPLLPDSGAPSLEELQRGAVTYLSTIQEPDGNLPAIINPFGGRTIPFDLVRLAHASWALLHFARETGDHTAQKTGERTYHYVTGLLGRYTYRKQLDPYRKILSLIYINRAAAVIADEKFSVQSTNLIEENSPELPDEPIIKLQFIQHLLASGAPRNDVTPIVDSVLARFHALRHDTTPIQLAAYVDLIPVLTTIDKLSEDDTYFSTAADLVRWYQDQQLPSGAFPITPNANYAYTRGTTKILEALSRQKERAGLLHEPLSWLRTMQYKTDSLYCVDPAWQQKICGGFRHDAHNGTIWIDAASHLLLIEKTA